MNKNNLPKITIVTVTYNSEKYLEETIKSVIQQNYPNLEYIIIDGASTDETINIIKKYEKYLTYWISEPDGGMYEALQKGFDKSTGDIMSWINSDDMYHPNAFLSVAEIFTNLQKVEWLTGANTNFDEKGRTIVTRPSYKHNKYSQFLYMAQHIQQESTFWKRSLWEKAGSMLDTSLRYAGDFELWLRFNQHSQVYITNALIGGFRFRKNQLTELYMPQYNQECELCLQNVKNSFNTYEKKILLELYSLKEKLDFSLLYEHEKIILENRMKTLSKQNNEIKFYKNKQKFDKEGNDLQNIMLTINKRRNTMRDFLEMLKLNQEYYPDIILDVGVANGTNELYETFPESEIVLFEPLVEFLPIMENIKKNYPLTAIEMCALGDKNDVITINVHPDLVGSSVFLEEEDSNVNGIPREVEMKTLESFADKYDLTKKSILLKVDVQGAEINVLKGALLLFKNIDVVILETSLFNFFNNNIILSDLIAFMDANDYVIYDMFGFLNRPIDGALAQVDVAFVHKSSRFREIQKFATKEQRLELNTNLTQNDKQSFITNMDHKFLNKLTVLLNNIDELTHVNKLLIYGDGTVGKIIYSFLHQNTIAFLDQKSELISKNIEKGTVYNPKNITNITYDKIIISVLGREEQIINYLTKELGVDKNKIIILKI